jgi:hypothetical protein
MKHTLKLAAFVAALVTPVIVSPQAMTGPAPVLRIGREIVKPGKDVPHTKMETAWSRAIEAANYPGHFIALTAMTGSNEAWFVWGYPSLADMQKENETADASATLTAIGERYSQVESEFLQDGRTMILTLRNDLSYTTGRPLSEMRFMSVTRILVRPGHTAEFVEARTAVKAAHEKAKLPDGYGIYQVVDGMPGGTFYLFAARKSLSELDDATKIHADPAYQAALGADWTKRNAALVAAYETSTEANIFSVSPGMSSVPKEWIAADSFWKPKAPPKKAP